MRHLTLRELRSETGTQPTRWVVRSACHIGGAVLLACMFAVINAFPDGKLVPLWRRIIFWSAMIAPCWLTTAAMIEVLRSRYRLKHLPDILLIGVLCSVTLAVPCAFVNKAIWHYFRETEVSLFQIFGYIATFNLITSSMIILLSGQHGHQQFESMASEDLEKAVVPNLDRLNERLPHPLRGSIHHMEAQDHYVKITTDKGSHLALLRFGDALQLASGLDGLRVHRSHWVSRAAIRKIVMRDGRAHLQLVSDAVVPISRAKVAVTRRWIAKSATN